jgi:hypothetical protein
LLSKLKWSTFIKFVHSSRFCFSGRGRNAGCPAPPPTATIANLASVLQIRVHAFVGPNGYPEHLFQLNRVFDSELLQQYIVAQPTNPAVSAICLLLIGV